MKIIIHAGIHRTGSTALQKCLFDNREHLQERGVVYPFDALNHQELAWALYRKDENGAALCNSLKEIESEGYEVVVLSGEDFCIHNDLHWLRILNDNFDVSAIFYLKRQDHWLMSWYNQHIKWPFNAKKSTQSPEDFLKDSDEFHWINYFDLLSRWSGILGKKSVNAEVVEKGQVENTTLDFLFKIGVSSSDLDINDEAVNSSLPVQALEIARFINVYKIPSKQRMRLNAALMRTFSKKDDGMYTVFSPEERNRILDKYEESNSAAAREFFSGKERLFNEPRPTADSPYFRFPDMDREQFMREWIAPVIRELVKPGSGK